MHYQFLTFLCVLASGLPYGDQWPHPWFKLLVTPLFVTISKDMERFLSHERFRND